MTENFNGRKKYNMTFLFAFFPFAAFIAPLVVISKGRLKIFFLIIQVLLFIIQILSARHLLKNVEE